MESERVANSRRQQPRLEDTFDVNSDETNGANDGEQDATEPRNLNPT